MMTGRNQWNLHGPVRTLDIETAEWNAEIGHWLPLKRRTTAMFRPDGQVSEIAHHNPDGSVPRHVAIYSEGGFLIEEQWWSTDALSYRIPHTYDAAGRPVSSVQVAADGTEHQTELCRYDDRGRKTKVSCLRVPQGTAVHYSISAGEGAYDTVFGDMSVSATGAVTRTTTYDEYDRPLEVTFHDAGDDLICRVVYERDGDGHIVSERMELEDPEKYFAPPGGANVSHEERAATAEMIRALLEDRTLMSATYTYDEKGRRRAMIRRMGRLSEDRMSVRYDDRNNPIEQVRADTSCSAEMNDGVMKIEESPSHVHHTRYEYRYDAHGNWTERVAWDRTEPAAEERRSNVERRTITYYEE